MVADITSRSTNIHVDMEKFTTVKDLFTKSIITYLQTFDHIQKPNILALYMKKPWLKHTLGLAKIRNARPLVLLVTRLEPWSLPKLHLKIDRNFKIKMDLR